MAAKSGRAKQAHAAEEKALRAHALAYPGAHEAFPWGERVVKVRGKVFVFMGRLEGGLGLSVKPPLALLKRWIDESYCAVAPKRLVASLAAEPAGDEKLTRRRAPRRLVHPRK